MYKYMYMYMNMYKFKMPSERIWRAAGDFSDVPSKNGYFSIGSNQSQTATGVYLRRPEGNVRRHVQGSKRRRTTTLKDLILDGGKSNPENYQGRRNGSSAFPRFQQSRRPAEVGFKGHRRGPSFHWRSGLREPKQTSGYIACTLFVDNISQGMTLTTLRNLFQRCGKVVDLFILTKIRKYSNVLFGFVRYETIQEARKSIEYFKGLRVQGRELTVSMARYEKGGAPVRKHQYPAKKKQDETNMIINAAIRDSRSYYDVVMGL